MINLCYDPDHPTVGAVVLKELPETGEEDIVYIVQNEDCIKVYMWNGVYFDPVPQICMEDLAPYKTAVEQLRHDVDPQALSIRDTMLTTCTKFKVNTGRISDYTFTIDGTPVTPVLRSGAWVIEHPVSVENWLVPFVIEVSDGGGVFLTITETAMSSVYSAVKNATTNTKAEVEYVTGLAIVAFGADEFFN